MRISPMDYYYQVDNMQTDSIDIYVSLNRKYHMNYLPYHIGSIRCLRVLPSINYLPLNCNKILMVNCYPIKRIILYNLPPLIYNCHCHIGPEIHDFINDYHNLLCQPHNISAMHIIECCRLLNNYLDALHIELRSNTIELY
jgi:hypothetical protein